MKKAINIILVIIAVILLVVASIQSLAASEENEEQIDLSELINTPQSSVEKDLPPDINDLPLRDNMDLYQYDAPDSVVTMYVTVREGNASDNTDHTWQEVNDFTKFFVVGVGNLEVGKAEAILQIGDENGPIPGEVGYGEIVPNATIQIRGNTASRRPQKSYKIVLRDRAGEWRGQSTISINKHFGDEIRVRNKLCFDLLKDIPDIVTLRTQFVHLYVKDETSEPPSDVFVDYGLFTQVEQPNTRFLRNHLLDRDAQLYKPNFFEFYRYPNQIRLADDPLYDEELFSTILEIKGNRDHSKLIQMLEDVNNLAIPIEQTFEKYFDADNYFNWLAFNLLVGNIDTQSQNYYLYSPQNSQKWYFLPWDYDGALFRQSTEIIDVQPYEYWEKGVGNYWGGVLHRRVLEVDKYRQMLDAKIDELMVFLTPERLESMLNTYRTVTDYYITRMPDLLHLPATIEEYDLAYGTLPNEIQINYQLYLESLDVSMPFYLGTPKVSGNKIQFVWDESYDFDAQEINYHFIVSRDWEFQDIVVEEKTTNFTTAQIDMLDSGTYFWRVTATNEAGKVQYPFDYY
ncbi:MAG: CotH kinase family protein, partial [Chloroflexota bacterium]|nr:CotH kinase family protein [Chloroflexota bacterium]